MQNAGRVSMADVATAAGVSLSTVSSALSGRGDLPAETRSRVQIVARELGYQRSPTPRGRPSTTDPRMIELVLGVFDDPWTDEVASGARSAAARLGYDLVLTSERDDPADDWPTRAASFATVACTRAVVSVHTTSTPPIAPVSRNTGE